MSLAVDLARAADPVVLAHTVGMRPDPWQAEVLRSGAPRTLLNCCRQSGKSTTAALMAVHQAVYSPGSLVLVVTPAQRQSIELVRTCTAFARHVAKAQETVLQLSFENGSRIIALPGSEATVRGYAGVDLLVIDEAAWVADDLYTAVRPMLAVSDGRLIAMSTPHGKRGWWSDEWHDLRRDWDRVKVTADQVPRISPAFLEAERAALGRWRFSQEYEGEFVSSEEALFSNEELDAMLAPVGGTL